MKIYLAHALTGAPEEFRQRMLALRHWLNQIRGVSVLEFNWIQGQGPDKTKNTYAFDMDHVLEADLMVGILDHPSIGLGMEIQERCRLNKYILLLCSQGTKVSQIIPDCIIHHKKLSSHSAQDEFRKYGSPLQFPIPCSTLEDMIETIVFWKRRIEEEMIVSTS